MSRRAVIGTWASVAIFVVAAVTFLVVDVIEGPVFSLSTKTWPPEVRGDKLIGGIEGAVKAADRGTSTVRIASGFLGLTSLRVVVTPNTAIAVNGKLGVFADLDRGQIVRVAYEVLPDRLLASRVDVLNGVASSEPLAPAPTSASPATAAPAPSPRVAPAASPRVAPAVVPRVTPPPESKSVPLVDAAPALPPRRRTVAPVSSRRAEARNTPRAAPAPAVSAPLAQDGSDAVDWLLKGQLP